MKVQFTIPETLEEITLGQYQQFVEMSKGLEGDDLDRLTVETFCGISSHTVNYIKASDVQDMVEHINHLFSINQELTPIVDIGGVEFGFIPSIDEISFGEYVDLDKYINSWESMHSAMAVMYRPIKDKIDDKYSIFDYEGAANSEEIMKHAPLSVVLGSMVFFYTLGNELLTATLRYSIRETKEVIIPHFHNLTSGGDGITAYMHLLEETLQNLTKPLEYVQRKHLPSSLMSLRKEK